jgi:O-antigen biosynthesis protein
MIKQLFILITDPQRLFNLLTADNFRRLWFCISTGQFSLVIDRIRLIHKNEPLFPQKLMFYSSDDYHEKLVFPEFNNPVVSIIIPVFNQWESTHTCLISILENSKDIPFEVLIADDASTDETCNILKYASNIKVISNKKNKGFLNNCNDATFHAKGDYLVFLNNDTIVQPGWLKPLLDLIKKDHTIGMVGSRLIYPNGELQEAGGIIWKDASGCNYGRFDSPERPEYNYLKEVDYVSGASMMIKKSLWNEIGGFDKRFIPAYYEDTDIAFEVRKRGYKVMYQPLSIIIHQEGRSHGRDIRSGIKKYQILNKTKFLNKWQKTLEEGHQFGVSDIFKARDRSTKKKTLLYIDHYVPFYDQDAGSKSTFQYLQLMAEMGYNIKFLGSNFANHQPYTTDLQQMGIEVLYGTWYRKGWKKWIVENRNNIDYIYLSRPHITRNYLGFIKKNTSSKLIYCGHDLNYLREARHYKVEGDKSLLLASQKWEKMELDIIRNVDVSYFFSDFESNELRKRLPACTVKTIPIFLFDESELERKKWPGFDSRSGILFVGGFNHPPNVDAMQWFVKEIFPIIKANLPGIELTIVGSNPTTDIIQLSGEGVTVAGRLSDEDLKQQYLSRRMVIAPLRYGAGVKGKIIEAMYYNLPTVTTSIGAEGIFDAEKTLFIGDEPQEFADLVIRAYKDSDVWNKTAEQMFHTIKKNYTKVAAREIIALDMPPA